MGEALLRLFHDGVDGIVFADRDGMIRGANEAFLNLTDSPNVAGVRGRSLADFLVRGLVDLKVLLDNARAVRPDAAVCDPADHRLFGAGSGRDIGDLAE